MKKSILSEDVISYLKENLEGENFLSVFLAGSKPEKLSPQNDLDIFVILNEKKVNEALNNLSRLLDKFVLENKEVVYSFFRGGAMKYKTKGLIHFIIYEDEEDFIKNELLVVLENLKTTSDLIIGKSVPEILQEVDFKDVDRKDKEKRKMINNYDLFKKLGKIMTLRWVKRENGWEHVKMKETPNKFFSEQIEKYYKKYYGKNLK